MIIMQPDVLFNLLSDVTRLRCLMLILQKKSLCVCELTYALNLTQPKISRHLALLKKFQVLVDRREGLWIIYSFNPKLPTWSKQVIKIALSNLLESQPYQKDRQRLAAMPNRPMICQLQQKRKLRPAASNG